MDQYYQREQRPPKKEKELNTKLIVYIGELPDDVDRCELDIFLTKQGLKYDTSHGPILNHEISSTEKGILFDGKEIPI